MKFKWIGCLNRKGWEMQNAKRRLVLDMTNKEARTFFLKKESYFNGSLPKYINLQNILNEAKNIMQRPSSRIEDKVKKGDKIGNLEGVNRIIIVSKDGAYAWRPLSLIHPLLYIDLVNKITKEENWNEIKAKFLEFQKDDRIECSSIPLESRTKKSDTAEGILNWWENLEQSQIKYALEYEYCIQTDITDCYSSIYTHTIPWAMRGKNEAKKDRKNGIGNEIDYRLQSMQMGQTNGIPQGSVLMDFIAEMVLGYADLLLSKKTQGAEFSEIKVLRYRDDYRIFSNSKEIAEKVIKTLSEILGDLNLKLNSKKTFLNQDIVIDAIKPDKVYWDMTFSSIISKKDKEIYYKLGIQKHLFQIKILGTKYPNCGSLKKALTEIYKNRIFDLKTPPENNEQLISIVVSIMIGNPVCFEYCTAILGKLFTFLDEKKLEKIFNQILHKFESTPNTDLAKIWLQSLSLAIPDMRYKEYDSILCQKVSKPSNIRIWNTNWLNKEFDEDVLIDEQEIKILNLIKPKEELDIFEEISL